MYISCIYIYILICLSSICKVTFPTIGFTEDVMPPTKTNPVVHLKSSTRVTKTKENPPKTWWFRTFFFVDVSPTKSSNRWFKWGRNDPKLHKTHLKYATRIEGKHDPSWHTLPETNGLPLKIGQIPEEISSSNHPFSGAKTLVSESVGSMVSKWDITYL